MPLLVPISDETSVDTYIPPQGYIVVFMVDTGSGLALKAKLPNGTIVDIGSAQELTPSEKQEADQTMEITAPAIVVETPLEAESVLVVEGAIVEGDTYILPAQSITN